MLIKCEIGIVMLFSFFDGLFKLIDAKCLLLFFFVALSGFSSTSLLLIACVNHCS